MNTASDDTSVFERELEIFGHEVDTVVQFLFAELAINAVAGRDGRVLAALNRTPLFWRTVAGGLQTAAFVAMGRVFDQRSPHNIDALIRLAQQQRSIFTKAALAERKRGGSSNADEWLSEYLRGVVVPTVADFRRMRKLIRKYRSVYDAQVDAIRDKYFAHKVVVDDSEVFALFAKTQVRDLEKLAAFLVQVHSAFWNLLHNGRRLSLRPTPYSVRRLAGQQLSRWSGRVQEAIVRDTKECLIRLAQSGTDARRPRAKAERRPPGERQDTRTEHGPEAVRAGREKPNGSDRGGGVGGTREGQRRSRGRRS